MSEERVGTINHANAQAAFYEVWPADSCMVLMMISMTVIVFIGRAYGHLWDKEGQGSVGRYPR
jgi:hypothetical protein